MTIRSLKAVVAASTLLALGLGANAAEAATATATARAKILSPITITKTADLDFATIITGATGASVVLTPANALTCPAPLVCTGTTTAAGFNVAGSTGAVVTVSAAGPATLTSGSNSMAFSAATVSAATLPMTAGTGSFTVGGTLAVGAAQADGVYTGTVTVTVNYQ